MLPTAVPGCTPLWKVLVSNCCPTPPSQRWASAYLLFRYSLCWVSQGSRLERQLRHAARLTAPPAKMCGRLGGKVPRSKLVGLGWGGWWWSVIHLASGFAKSQKVGSVGCRGRAFHKDSVIPGSSSYLGKKPERGFSKRENLPNSGQLEAMSWGPASEAC